MEVFMFWQKVIDSCLQSDILSPQCQFTDTYIQVSYYGSQRG